MTAERAAKLEALGFVWEGLKSHLEDGKWEEQLARLTAYKAVHGDCSVPRGWAEDLGLSNWVHRQRKHKKKLDRGEYIHGRMTAERAARLTALDFVWDLGHSSARREEEWEEQLARLAAYKAVHGDCNVPKQGEDPRLGNWVNNQRHNKKKLDRGEPSKGMTAERVARLTALGFVWDPPRGGGPKHVGGHPNDAAWEKQLARLVAYKAAYGDCNVPQGWAENPRLASWVTNQRVYKRKLDRGEPSKGMTATRAARLTALGFVWDPGLRKMSAAGAAGRARPKEAEPWEAHLARLAVYKVKHGDCDVSQAWAEDPQLGTWARHQRERKRKLDRGEPSKGMTLDRAAKLTALGFVWAPRSQKRQMCEGCGLKHPSYGLASEGKKRWCAGCRAAEGAEKRLEKRPRGTAGATAGAGAKRGARSVRAREVMGGDDTDSDGDEAPRAEGEAVVAGVAAEAAEEVKAEPAPVLEPTIKREPSDSGLEQQQQQQPMCVRSAKRRAVWARDGAGDDPRAHVVAEEAAS
jgi:hypothetical protein